MHLFILFIHLQHSLVLDELNKPKMRSRILIHSNYGHFLTSFTSHYEIYRQKINLCNQNNCSQIDKILYLQNLLLLNDHFIFSDYSFSQFIEESSDKHYPAKQKVCCMIMLLLMLSGNVHPNPGPVPGLSNTLQSLATPSEFKSRHGLGFIHSPATLLGTPC